MTILSEYARRTPRSRDHFTKVERIIPAGATRSLNAWPPYPVYVESGSSGRIRDIDGNSYLDFLANYTALPLGYDDPDVTSALRKQLSTGTAHSFSRTLENELAKVLTTRVPSLQKIRFTGSGTEAVMFSLRLARAFTGRSAIAKAEGGYHGTTDDVMVSVRPSPEKAGDPHAPEAVPEMPGIPVSRITETVVLPYNNIEASIEMVRRHADRLAALVLEPVLGVGGMIPVDREYLVAMRRLCDELGILLIFDEVITLRLAIGGAQQAYGVTPDLTTMGKIIGGGMPIGAYGGRADVMALLEPQGGTDVYDSRSGGPVLYQGGTFTGNAMSLTAGITTMRKLDAPVINELNDKGGVLRQRLATELATAPVQAVVTGIGSLFNVHVGVGEVRTFRDTRKVKGSLQHAFFIAMLNRGVILAPRGMGCVSTCTSAADIEIFATAVGASLNEIANIN